MNGGALYKGVCLKPYTLLCVGIGTCVGVCVSSATHDQSLSRPLSRGPYRLAEQRQMCSCQIELVNFVLIAVVSLMKILSGNVIMKVS